MVTTTSEATRWLTRREAAERLRISLRQLDRLVADGVLRARRLASRVLFDPEELDAAVRAK